MRGIRVSRSTSVATVRDSGRGDPGRMSRFELHGLFREMVRAEMTRGPWTSAHRKRVRRFARTLGIGPDEADRLIQETQRAHPLGHDAVPEAEGTGRSGAQARPAGFPYPVGLKLSAALAGVLLLKLAWVVILG